MFYSSYANNDLIWSNIKGSKTTEVYNQLYGLWLQVPSWLRDELAETKVGVGGVMKSDLQADESDGNLADDTSGQSEEDRKHKTFDTSMSSIQINRDLTPCKVGPDKNLTPRNSDLHPSIVIKVDILFLTSKAKHFALTVLLQT